MAEADRLCCWFWPSSSILGIHVVIKRAKWVKASQTGYPVTPYWG